MVPVTVKTITGKTHIFDCDPSTTVAELREQAHRAFELPPESRVRLLYAGQELTDTQTIADTNYKSGDTIAMIPTRLTPPPAAPPAQSATPPSNSFRSLRVLPFGNISLFSTMDM
jgi:hypothetical protein